MNERRVIEIEIRLHGDDASIEPQAFEAMVQAGLPAEIAAKVAARFAENIETLKADQDRIEADQDQIRFLTRQMRWWRFVALLSLAFMIGFDILLLW